MCRKESHFACISIHTCMWVCPFRNIESKCTYLVIKGCFIEEWDWQRRNNFLLLLVLLVGFFFCNKHLLIMQSKRRTSKTSNALNESWLFDDRVEKK